MLKKYLTILFLGLIIKNYLYAQNFKNIAKEIGIEHYANRFGGGVCIFDYNNDGNEDIFLAGGINPCALYENKIDTFINVINECGIFIDPELVTTCSGACDIDNDGDLDLFVGGRSYYNNIPTILLFINNKSYFKLFHIYNDIIIKPNWVESISFGDVNLDGNIDIYLGNYQKNLNSIYNKQGNEIGYDVDCYPNTLLLNLGDLKFLDVSTMYAVNDYGCTFSGSFSDYDKDGDLDILIANDFGEWNNKGNKVLQNNYPLPYFKDVSDSLSFNDKMYGMSVATGDIDNDLENEYYVSNIGKNVLLKFNQNTSHFENLAPKEKVEREKEGNDYKTNWGSIFVDINNDSYIDLYSSSSYFDISFPRTAVYDLDNLYINNFGTFKDISKENNFNKYNSSRGCSSFDYNHDGKQDIIAQPVLMQNHLNDNFSYNTLFYKNIDTNTNCWIDIKLNGNNFNCDGIGCKIYLYSDKIELYKELQLGSQGHSSQSSNLLHFGLGSNNKIDSIIIYWPGLKDKQIIDENIKTNTINYINAPENYSIKPIDSIYLEHYNNQQARVLREQFYNKKNLPANINIITPNDLIFLWTDQLITILQESNGFTPPVSSMVISYIYISIYECLVLTHPDLNSLSNYLNIEYNEQYRKFQSENNNLNDDIIVINEAFYNAIKLFIPTISYTNEGIIDSLHNLINNRYNNDKIKQLREIYSSITGSIYKWTLNDSIGKIGYINNFPADYKYKKSDSTWRPTPAPFSSLFNFKSAMQPFWGERKCIIKENNLELSKSPYLFSTDTASSFYKEVYNVYNQSKQNTKEQSDIAKFWSDDFGTTPACHSLSITNQVTEQHNINYKDRIIILLKSSIALNDAFINCFKNKYYYNLLRPVTYIQRYIDSTWNALIPTPPFPEYPSCHSTQTAANATILKLNLNNTGLYDFSREKFGFPVKKINTFDDYANEVAISRFYGGVHYKFSNEEGLRLGKIIGKNINSTINNIIYKIK